MTVTQSQQRNAEALRDLRILIDEYDPQNSDWGFRRAVIKSVLDRLDAVPAAKAAGDDGTLWEILNEFVDDLTEQQRKYIHDQFKRRSASGDVRAAVIEDLAVMARVKSIGVHAKHDAKNTYVVSLTFEGGEQPTLQQFQNLRTAALSQAPATDAPTRIEKLETALREISKDSYLDDYELEYRPTAAALTAIAALGASHD